MSSRDKPFEMTAGDIRVHFRDALDHVRAGTDVHITRWNKIEAVLVHPEWYAEARELMATLKRHE